MKRSRNLLWNQTEQLIACPGGGVRTAQKQFVSMASTKNITLGIKRGVYITVALY